MKIDSGDGPVDIRPFVLRPLREVHTFVSNTIYSMLVRNSLALPPFRRLRLLFALSQVPSQLQADNR